jgi:hypothetical protein
MRLLVAGIAGLVITTTAVASTRYQVDLATGNLDGKRVLGRSLADVRTTLGRPDLIAGPRNRRLVAWGGGAGTFRLAVLFRPTGNRLLARTLVFESGSIRDAKIGDLLGRAPRSLQVAVESNYRGVFELVRPYRCRTVGLCTGEFAARSGGLHLTFGRTSTRGTFVTVWTS